MAISPSQALPFYTMASAGNDNQYPPSNLSEAIFRPFSGFRAPPLSSETTLSQTQRLQKIIDNVENQQSLVRGYMVYLTCEEAENSIGKAEQELIHVGEADMEVGIAEEDEAMEIVKARNEKRREANTLVKSMHKRAIEGATAEDYTRIVRAKNSKGASQISRMLSRKRLASGELKIENADVDAKLKPRLPQTIRTEISTDLRTLIVNSIEQLEAYDKRSLLTLDHYTQALARRASRSDPFPALIADGSVFETTEPITQSLAASPIFHASAADASSPPPIRKVSMLKNAASPSPIKNGSILKSRDFTPQRAPSGRLVSRASPSTPKKVRFASDSEFGSIAWTTSAERATTVPVCSMSSGLLDWTTTPERAATFPLTSTSPFSQENKVPGLKSSKSPIFKSPRSLGLRRTSTGMPIAGSSASEPVRKVELIEQLARR